MKTFQVFFIFTLCSLVLSAQNSRYVDPCIGSEGLGRVFIGPSYPYGMVKPGPDCTTDNNSGWAPMPQQVNGFSQIHVSGTGGGCKYGNILIQPFSGELAGTSHIDYRSEENIELGLYQTTYTHSGIHTRLTTAERAAFYTFTYKDDPCLLVDVGFYLGETSNPQGREAQQFVGSEIQVLGPNAVCGYSRIRGGWNNGRAYTVYFYLETDKPITHFKTWKELTQVQQARGDAEEGMGLSSKAAQADSGHKTGALLAFGKEKEVKVKVGISFLSSLKAQENMQQEIPHWDFHKTHRELLDRWNGILDRVCVDETTSEADKRMLYTGIYHTMLMPVDRTGENPGWNDGVYYDDFYAIWDTYRTSTPLITLLDPHRQEQIVNALLNIYKHDGYMPDARSGNANGRTQGGSNAEIVIADALAKGLEGIDYELALEAMLKDATVPPGGNEEAEGRGGLQPYLEKGYIPYGIPRAGNRTVEYSFCDWAIAQVARYLGKEDLYAQYMKQSRNWQNIWRKDYEQDGVKGFIMPRSAQGTWLDSIPFGHSRRQIPKFLYTPDTSYEGPWYMPWWSCYFYEASSWEYSLSVPHDVPALVEYCGGAEAFEKRLDTFFYPGKGYYNVANEPSFLTPCLYHWIGKPEKTGQMVRSIIQRYFHATPSGIPGNDDSGSMSSWLVFHMLGLYPNAGHDYYLVHEPLVKGFSLKQENGRTVTMRMETLPKSSSLKFQALWNGKELKEARITHARLLEGGELVIRVPRSAKVWPQKEQKTVPETVDKSVYTHRFSYSLHGQTRRFSMWFEKTGQDVRVHWGIERNLKWWTGSYLMTRAALENAEELCYVQPLDRQHLRLENQTFGVLSRKAFREVKETGRCHFNHTVYRCLSATEGRLLLRDEQEGAEMLVADDEELPIIWSMQNNPVEIDWKASLLH